MEERDDKLERYLKEFRPRAVRALKVPEQSRNAWMKRPAAAAVVILAGSISVWFTVRSTHKGPETTGLQEVEPAPTPTAVPLEKNLSALALTKMALDDRKQFDALMTAESRLVLPNLRGAESTLGALAKE